MTQPHLERVATLHCKISGITLNHSDHGSRFLHHRVLRIPTRISCKQLQTL